MAKTDADFLAFQKRVDAELMTHAIIVKNDYTNHFEKADLTEEEVRDFLIQFSVFSNFFMIAQLKKVINAETLEEMHASKEILLNELGVIFNRKSKESKASQESRDQDKDNQGDPALVNTEGTIDGGTFRFKAAHFEWLLDIAKSFNLGFLDIGKRHHGSKSTLYFTDALERIYASEDFNTASGASFAIENWAAAGFWKQLITGLKRFKEKSNKPFKLAFFTWHDKVEEQHAEHTQDELKEIFFYDNFNEEQFLKAGNEMLDACQVFWDGLLSTLKSKPNKNG